MSRKVVKEEILEMKWRCEVPDRFTGEPCGHENRGSAIMCAKCFHPRPEGEHIFYLPEDARVVTDADELGEAMAGPDWKCMSCGYDNKYGEVYCHQCRELRKEDEEQWLEMGGDRKSMRFGEGEISKSAEDVLRKKQKKASNANAKAGPEARAGGSPSGFFNLAAKKYAVAAAVILLIVVVWFFFFKTTRAEFQVSGFYWERQVGIEKAKMVTEENWSIPSGGNIVSRETRVHHYDQVIDGYREISEPVFENVKVGMETYECGTETLANGYVRKKTCERPVYERRQVRTELVKEPVYKKVPVQQTWYTYRIRRWFPYKTETASAKDQNPRWPVYTLGANERVGEKTEKYVLNLAAMNPDEKFKAISYPMDEASWKRVKNGQRFIAELTRLGVARELKAP